MKEHIKIYTGTSILTNRLVFLLKEARITSIIRDQGESGRLAGFGTSGNSVELFILNDNIEKARNIVELFKKEISN